MTEASENNTPILSRLSPPAGAVHRKRRKGRGPGSGLGKTAGKGMKGQKARSPGNFSKLGFEGGQTPLYRRLPKRGFHNPASKNFATVNVSDLAKFDADSNVCIDALKTAGLIPRKSDIVKILGNGELSVKLNVRANAFSASAKTKIEAAGGSVEDIGLPTPAPVVRHKNKKNA